MLIRLLNSIWSEQYFGMKLESWDRRNTVNSYSGWWWKEASGKASSVRYNMCDEQGRGEEEEQL